MNGRLEEEQRSARQAVWLTRAALFSVPLLMVGFALRFEMGIPDAAFAGALLVALPILAFAQLMAGGAAAIDRPSAYLSSSATILLLASVALILGALGPGLPALGLGPVDPTAGGSMLALLLTGVGLLTLGFHATARQFGIQETRLLEYLLPVTPHEKRMFILLSFLAGFGEEIVYRGYLLALLIPLFPSPWTVALVTSLAFGLLHAYQGALGIARTGMLGFLFAASVLVGGSLWPAIACHVIVDLIGGLWLGPRLLRQDA